MESRLKEEEDRRRAQMGGNEWKDTEWGSGMTGDTPHLGATDYMGNTRPGYQSTPGGSVGQFSEWGSNRGGDRRRGGGDSKANITCYKC